MPKTRQRHKPPDLHVIVTISGGVADVACKPIGVAVTVFDYDVNDVEKVSLDPDGEKCFLGHWPSHEEVKRNDHWWIAKQARPSSIGRYLRQWKCPSCSRTASVTYEELAEVGWPICTDCDQPMELL